MSVWNRYHPVWRPGSSMFILMRFNWWKIDAKYVIEEGRVGASGASGPSGASAPVSGGAAAEESDGSADDNITLTLPAPHRAPAPPPPVLSARHRHPRYGTAHRLACPCPQHLSACFNGALPPTFNFRTDKYPRLDCLVTEPEWSEEYNNNKIYLKLKLN